MAMPTMVGSDFAIWPCGAGLQAGLELGHDQAAECLQVLAHAGLVDCPIGRRLPVLASARVVTAGLLLGKAVAKTTTIIPPTTATR